MSAKAAFPPTVGILAKSPAKAPKSLSKSPKKAISKHAKKSSDKAKANHPRYQTMITTAIKNLKERNGSSKQAIFKYIMANYDVGSNVTFVNSLLRQALKRGLQNQILKQTKGQGASGSFRLGEKPASSKKVKKPVAKKTSKETLKRSSPKKVVKRPKKNLTVSAAFTSEATKNASTNSEAVKKVKAKKLEAPKKSKTPKKAKAVKPIKAAKSPNAKPSKKSPIKKSKNIPKKRANA